MDKTDTNELLNVHKTRESLLLRLKGGGNEQAWREFHAVYGRLIFGYSLRYGISYAEAEDIVQEVCIKVFRRIVQFDYSPERGRFRGWLKTITRNTVIDYIRRKQRRRNTAEEFRELSALELLEQEDADNNLWRLEWRKALYEAALERVSKRIGAETLRVFNEYVLGDKSAEDLANETSLEINSIYSVKHRVLGYVKEEVKKILMDEEVEP